MILPQAPFFRSEDYSPEVRTWVGTLLSPLNTFVFNATTAINGRLTFSDNMAGQQKSLSFSYSSATLPISFTLSMSVNPQGLDVVQATENGTPVIVLAAWKVSGSSVQITDLVKLSKGVASSLVSGATYNLTIRVAA